MLSMDTRPLSRVVHPVAVSSFRSAGLSNLSRVDRGLSRVVHPSRLRLTGCRRTQRVPTVYTPTLDTLSLLVHIVHRRLTL